MSTAVLSWTLRRVLRSPLAWLTWAVTAALVPVLELVSPIGLTTRAGRPGAWLGEVATAAALAGAVFGLEGLAGARGLLQRHAALARPVAGLAIAWTTAIFTFPGVLAAFFFLSAANLTIPVTDVVGVALTASHAAALAWLLALLPIPDGVRSILLVFLAWGLSGWISPAGLPTVALSTLVDVSHASRIDLRAVGWSARITAVAPIMLLVGACLLLRPARPSSS
jgi:hypothetical protein